MSGRKLRFNMGNSNAYTQARDKKFPKIYSHSCNRYLCWHWYDYIGNPIISLKNWDPFSSAMMRLYPQAAVCQNQTPQSIFFSPAGSLPLRPRLRETLLFCPQTTKTLCLVEFCIMFVKISTQFTIEKNILKLYSLSHLKLNWSEPPSVFWPLNAANIKH